MAQRVRITEVGPRDGLQNEPGVISTPDKVRLVELCALSGVDEVEVTSFVSPKWVPQLGDAMEVFELLRATDLTVHRTMFSALVPNERGMESAERVAMNPTLLEKVSVFTAASETFARKNINASIAESMERFAPVVGRAHTACGGEMLVRGYVSCAIACPFEGPIDPARVGEVARSLLELGVDEIDLGDTIGAATPETTRALIKGVCAKLGCKPGHLGERHEPLLTLHFHDTFGHAAECVRAALEMGVRSFDASVAGLGGCPYASTPGKRAPGNISTQTLVETVHAMGFKTGVDMIKLKDAAQYALGIVARARAQGAGA